MPIHPLVVGKDMTIACIGDGGRRRGCGLVEGGRGLDAGRGQQASRGGRGAAGGSNATPQLSRTELAASLSDEMEQGLTLNASASASS